MHRSYHEKDLSNINDSVNNENTLLFSDLEINNSFPNLLKGHRKLDDFMFLLAITQHSKSF